ncbi:MAG: HK97 family phage prohead protease [Alphaproteobacteria bacterium]|jgi:hypothetical protein|nr:HK97 family phage prohead protease [Alphaproteobacteria bacterium]
MKDLERRNFEVAIEVRADEGEDPVIVGHAAVFNQLSVDLGGFREKIAPGAFSKAIGGDVRALFNHDPNLILGRSVAKTLRLAEDSTGLAVEIDPPATATARHVVEAMRRGDVSQMSFGFRTIKDEWTRGEPGEPSIRTLLEVELFDVSPVTFPAYPQTDVAVRSLETWRASDADAGEGHERFRRLLEARTRQAETAC